MFFCEFRNSGRRFSVGGLTVYFSLAGNNKIGILDFILKTDKVEDDIYPLLEAGPTRTLLSLRIGFSTNFPGLDQLVFKKI